MRSILSRSLIAVGVWLMLPMGALPLTRADEPLTVMKTPGGREFALLGKKPSSPAPTLFVFANTFANSLTSDDYNKVGKLLAEHGVLSVAFDLPCHGAQRRDGEPDGLDGWRARLDKGENPIQELCRDAQAVLDHLIAQGYTNPERIAACGTSRGGFAALHFAASDPRVRCVAAFAPVTDLPVLREFQGMSAETARMLGAVSLADRLCEQPVWLIIGPHDERVGTDATVAVARAINLAAVARKKLAQVELHVQPSEGHRTPKSGHADAAIWLARQLELAAP
ncbi:MAG: alpha/beta hydrolase family protein [Planctomycetales bacterium]